MEATQEREGAERPAEDAPRHVVHGGEREGEVTATGDRFRLPERGTKSFWQKVIYVLAYCIYVPASAILFRALRVDPRIPRTGASLLLSNHTSVMDPAWVAFHSWRMDVHFMASSTLFNIKGLSLLIQSLGAFPKAKQVKDRGAMALMTDIYDRGGLVVMFPEGERTWDGRTVPVAAGLGRLLRRRHYTVITSRNLTGYFFQPRWARYPRWVPIHIEYDPPISYGDTMTPEEINADILKRISVDMRGRRAPRFSFGWRMAHGLPGFLWACPACFTPEGLAVAPDDGNVAACGSCGERWRVDVSAWIHPRKGEGMPVYAAYDHIVRTLTPERISGGRRTADGQAVLLERAGSRLVKMIRKGHSEVIAEGTARLLPHRLQIVDAAGAPIWESTVAGLTAINLDVGSQLFLRHEGHLLRLEPGEDSRVKWAHFMRLYHPEYQTAPPMSPLTSGHGV